MAVDLTSNRIVVSDRSIGTGVALDNLRDLALDSLNNRAFVIDGNVNALIVVELETGERAISAR